MDYSRYSPCLPDVQEQLITEYQRSMGILPEKEKAQKKKKN